MFTYILLDKETLSQETITRFAKYDGRTELFETKAFSLIKESQQLVYLEALEPLFINYKLAEEHLSNIHFIIGQHLYIYNDLIEKRADELEIYEFLTFIRNYRLQNEELKTQYPNVEKQIVEDQERYIEFKTHGFTTDYPIKLHNIHLIANGIYNYTRTQSTGHLWNILEPFTKIPSLDIIEGMVGNNNYIVDYPTRYFLAELTEDLLKYIDGIVPNKHRFVFDFMLLSNIFELDLVEDKEKNLIFNEKTIDYRPTSSYKIPTFITGKEKTAYMRGILKTYHKFYSGK